MNKLTDIALKLRRCKGLHVLLNEPLKRHTSFRIGGPARIFVSPETTKDLIFLLKNSKGIKKYIIGNGSNLLLPDKGINAIIIRISGNMSGFHADKRKVLAGAGIRMQALINKTLKLGLSGLEFAAGVPASLGGAISMNMGAKGSNIGELVEYLDVMDRAGNTRRMGKKELKFAYRKSNIRDLIITNVCLKLKFAKVSDIKKKIDENLKWRKESQPLSVFKNPKDVPAGKLIDMASLKGERVGDAEISRKHGNFIINLGDAKCEDVNKLIKKIKTKVKEQFRVGLELELIDSKHLNMIF
jgi:UDP-N-acetylmuramate dehydrogenase